MSTADAAHDALAAELVRSFPLDAARALERFDAEDIALILADAAAADVAAVMRAMATSLAREALEMMDAERAAAIVSKMSVPWAAAMLRAAPPERLDAVLDNVPGRAARGIRRALRHGARTLGSIADPAVLSLAPDVAVERAIEEVRARPEAESDRIYVVSRDGRLVGVVGVGEVVAAAAGTRLAELMQTEVVAIDSAETAAAAATHPGWVRWRSLPVVDGDRHMVGVVRYEAVQRLLLDAPTAPASSLSLPLSLAELYWLGLAGVTDGLARTVASRMVPDDG